LRLHESWACVDTLGRCAWVCWVTVGGGGYVCACPALLDLLLTCAFLSLAFLMHVRVLQMRARPSQRGQRDTRHPNAAADGAPQRSAAHGTSPSPRRPHGPSPARKSRARSNARHSSNVLSGGYASGSHAGVAFFFFLYIYIYINHDVWRASCSLMVKELAQNP
jgi:hypothetical protein